MMTNYLRGITANRQCLRSIQQNQNQNYRIVDFVAIMQCLIKKLTYYL